MGHAGKSYVRNQPKMNKGVANLRLGGMHLNRICISLKFGQLNHVWMAHLRPGLGGHVGEVSSWEIRQVIPGPESTCKPLGLFGDVAQRIRTQFSSPELVLKIRRGLTSQWWLAVKWTMLLHRISIPWVPINPHLGPRVHGAAAAPENHGKFSSA